MADIKHRHAKPAAETSEIAATESYSNPSGYAARMPLAYFVLWPDFLRSLQEKARVHFLRVFTHTAPPPLQIACLGDSIVHGGCDGAAGGWVQRLRLHVWGVGQGDHIFNLGIGGDTSRDILGRLRDDLRSRLGHVDHVLISCGTNDILHGKKATSEAEYADNLQAMAAQIREFGKQGMMCTMTPWNPASPDISPAQWARRTRTNDLVRALCASTGFRCIDLAEAFHPDDLVDSVHPGPAGHAAICQVVVDRFLAEGLLRA